MNRAERRTRTERIASARTREARHFMPGSELSRQHIRGMARTRSLFDCGHTQCATCRRPVKETHKRRLADRQIDE